MGLAWDGYGWVFTLLRLRLVDRLCLNYLKQILFCPIPGGNKTGADLLGLLAALSQATGQAAGDGLFFKAVAEKQEALALDLLRKNPSLVCAIVMSSVCRSRIANYRLNGR